MESSVRPQEHSNSRALGIYLRAVLFSRISRVPGARMWALVTPSGLVPLHTNRAAAERMLDGMRAVARQVDALVFGGVIAEGGTRESDVAAPALASSDARAVDRAALSEQSAEGAALVLAAVKSSAGAIEAPRDVRTWTSSRARVVTVSAPHDDDGNPVDVADLLADFRHEREHVGEELRALDAWRRDKARRSA